MAWGRREEAGDKGDFWGLPKPSQSTQQCSSPAREGIPKGQMGDGSSKKEVKISLANPEWSSDPEAPHSALFRN